MRVCACVWLCASVCERQIEVLSVCVFLWISKMYVYLCMCVGAEDAHNSDYTFKHKYLCTQTHNCNCIPCLAQSILEPIRSYSQWHAKTSSLFLKLKTQAGPKIIIIISGASKPGKGSQCESSLNLQSFKWPARSVFTCFKILCNFM